MNFEGLNGTPYGQFPDPGINSGGEIVQQIPRHPALAEFVGMTEWSGTMTTARVLAIL
jgi:hypothetical protein